MLTYHMHKSLSQSISFKIKYRGDILPSISKFTFQPRIYFKYIFQNHISIILTKKNYLHKKPFTIHNVNTWNNFNIIKINGFSKNNNKDSLKTILNLAMTASRSRSAKDILFNSKLISNPPWCWPLGLSLSDFGIPYWMGVSIHYLIHALYKLAK